MHTPSIDKRRAELVDQGFVVEIRLWGPDHSAVGAHLLRSIEEVGLLQQLPRFAMQRVFVSYERL
jgi:hypothetical protein